MLPDVALGQKRSTEDHRGALLVTNSHPVCLSPAAQNMPERGTLHLQPSIQEKRPSPDFPQNAICFSTLRGGVLLFVFSPTNAKKNQLEYIRDHDVDMAYHDEKLDVDKQGDDREVSASDAALTRRILLKLDFRYLPAYLSLPFISIRDIEF